MIVILIGTFLTLIRHTFSHARLFYGAKPKCCCNTSVYRTSPCKLSSGKNVCIAGDYSGAAARRLNIISHLPPPVVLCPRDAVTNHAAERPIASMGVDDLPTGFGRFRSLQRWTRCSRGVVPAVFGTVHSLFMIEGTVFTAAISRSLLHSHAFHFSFHTGHDA